MLTQNIKIEDKIIFDEPMKKHTSFKIGGTADQFIEVTTIGELNAALTYARDKNLPITIIGNGSNLLVLDKGIRGLVIQINLQDLKIEKTEKNIQISVGAGYKLMALTILLMKQGFSGLEELAGIPGTIGGAIYMNAGAYGKEIKDFVLTTTCMDLAGNQFELSNQEQEFSYRSSIFHQKNYIILETKLKLTKGKQQEIQEKMNKYLAKRKEKQPLNFPSAGSTFKRKEGVITAKLIDECGLKGYQIGGAKISEKHSGFIINYNHAKAEDVLDLIQYTKDKVYEKFGIKIEEEIKVIGER